MDYIYDGHRLLGGKWAIIGGTSNENLSEKWGAKYDSATRMSPMRDWLGAIYVVAWSSSTIPHQTVYVGEATIVQLVSAK